MTGAPVPPEATFPATTMDSIPVSLAALPVGGPELEDVPPVDPFPSVAELLPDVVVG